MLRIRPANVAHQTINKSWTVKFLRAVPPRRALYIVTTAKF